MSNYIPANYAYEAEIAAAEDAAFILGRGTGQADVHRFLLSTSGDQVLTPDVYTRLNWTGISHVAGLTVDLTNNRVTVTKEGSYTFWSGGSINRSGVASISGRYLRRSIFKNNVLIISADSDCRSNAEEDVLTYTLATITCSVGDYIEVFHYHNDAGGTVRHDSISPDGTSATFGGFLRL